MSNPPAVGSLGLAKYQLMGEIGHGGMATVYRAKDLRLDREVALKLIHPHLRENKEVAARFVSEARAVAKLRHPGIVEVFDVSDADDSERFLVTELVRGPSLRKILDEHREMPPEIGACFGVLLCDALAHAHDTGIVHRDVKPENVLVELVDARRTVQVKLTDFGIAKVLDTQGVTSTGQVLGSPAHMAPEQIEGGQVDARADVFSLGVLVYGCMVGHLPFEGKNPAQVLRRVLDCSYAPADKERPTVGVRWASILARAISRRPTDRYASVKAFGAEMQRELRDLGIEDELAEIYRYLADSEGYAKEIIPQLVSRLVARAQREQSQGNTQAAAADLNRAVAYSPDNVDLLRRLAALARGERRKRILRQAGQWGALAAALFLVALVVARHGRQRSTGVPALPVSSENPGASAPSAGLTPASLSAATASASTRVPSIRLPTGQSVIIPTLRHLAHAVERDVTIRANPQSALVSIDGEEQTAVGFELMRRLSVGRHAFTFTVTSDNPCCLPTTYHWEIKPDDGTGPQVVMGSLRFREATIALVGAPADARLRCPEVEINIGQGVEARVSMQTLERHIACFFEGAGKDPARQIVELHPGSPTSVKWASHP